MIDLARLQADAPANDRSGYQMIRTLDVHNFRCFKHASLTDLKRINLLVGKNASGKTTLLEAIFLTLGSNVNAVSTLRGWRGFETSLFQGTPSAFHDMMWRDLFNEYNGKKSIRITSKGDDAQTRELVITPVDSNAKIVDDGTSYSHSGGVKFKWTGKNQKDFEDTPTITQGGLQTKIGESTPAEVFLYAANQTSSSRDFANRFSELSKRMRVNDYVDVFKARYPAIETMSVEVYAGAPMVFAKVRDVSEMIPLTLVSGGINKFAAILLSFASSPRSVVLIDEIENGLYHRDLPKIWELLRDFSEKFDCQIFASTHSEECIVAAASVAELHQTSFSVIQAENGKLNQFRGEKLVWAAEQDIDIR